MRATAERLSFQDPQDVLKEECALKKECVKLQEELDRCTERVNSRTNTSETCAQELYDFLHCVDHCVSKYSNLLKSHVHITFLTFNLLG